MLFRSWPTFLALVCPHKSPCIHFVSTIHFLVLILLVKSYSFLRAARNREQPVQAELITSAAFYYHIYYDANGRCFLVAFIIYYIVSLYSYFCYKYRLGDCCIVLLSSVLLTAYIGCIQIDHNTVLYYVTHFLSTTKATFHVMLFSITCRFVRFLL